MRDDDDKRKRKLALHDRALDRDGSTRVTAMATAASPDDSVWAEFVREVVEEAAGEDSSAAARMLEQGNVAAWMHTDAAPHSPHRQVNVDGTMGPGQRPGEESADLGLDALTQDLIDWTQALASGSWDSKEAAGGGQARGQEKENPEEGIQDGDGAESGCGTGRQPTDKLVSELLMAASIGKCQWRVAGLGLCRNLVIFLWVCSCFALSPPLRLLRRALELSAVTVAVPSCHLLLDRLPPLTLPSDSHRIPEKGRIPPPRTPRRDTLTQAKQARERTPLKQLPPPAACPETGRRLYTL